MDDVNRGIGHFRQRDGSRRSLRLSRRGTGKRVVLGRGFAFRQRLFDDHVDGFAVSACIQTIAPALANAHGFENAGVVKHENARISHEG